MALIEIAMWVAGIGGSGAGGYFWLKHHKKMMKNPSYLKEQERIFEKKNYAEEKEIIDDEKEVIEDKINEASEISKTNSLISRKRDLVKKNVQRAKSLYFLRNPESIKTEIENAKKTIRYIGNYIYYQRIIFQGIKNDEKKAKEALRDMLKKEKDVMRRRIRIRKYYKALKKIENRNKKRGVMGALKLIRNLRKEGKQNRKLKRLGKKELTESRTTNDKAVSEKIIIKHILRTLKVEAHQIRQMIGILESLESTKINKENIPEIYKEAANKYRKLSESLKRFITREEFLTYKLKEEDEEIIQEINEEEKTENTEKSLDHLVLRWINKLKLPEKET